MPTHIFQEFHKAQISYCHWKSNEHVKAGLEGNTDLDILVADNQENVCRNILSSSGFKQVFPPKYAQYPNIEDWMGLDEHNGVLLHLHLHYKLLTGKRFVKEQRLPFELHVLKSRVFDEQNDVYVANPNVELILLTLRLGLKTQRHKRDVSESVRKEITFLRSRSDETMIKQWTVLLFGNDDGEKLFQLVMKLIDSPNTQTRREMQRFATTALSSFKRFSSFKSTTLYLLRTLRVKITRPKKILHPRGVIIALVGADGSGKSTSIKQLSRWLSWKLAVHACYLGWNLSIRSRFRQSTLKPANSIKTSKQPKELVSLLSVVVKYLKIRHAYIKRSHGYIVLTDRYPQNTVFGTNDGRMLDEHVTNHWFHTWAWRLEKKIFDTIEVNYPPDIVMKLHVSPEKAIERKPDHRKESIEKKIEVIKQLSFRQSTIVNIDATREAKTVLMDIKTQLWNAL